MVNVDINSIRTQIQYNCDVESADYITPILHFGTSDSDFINRQIQQLYAHEKDLQPWEEVDENDFDSWDDKKAELWDSIFQKGFRHQDIQIAGRSYHHVNDIDAINEELIPAGYFYVYNYGSLLAEIKESWSQDGYDCYILGKELAKISNKISQRCINTRKKTLRKNRSSAKLRS